MNFFNDKIAPILEIIIMFLLVAIITLLLITKKDKEEQAVEEPILNIEEKEIVEEPKELSKIKVDIKGAINSPGVYELDEGTIINDLINLAGGLTKNGTTKNINLSKKLYNEMVIYIYTTSELKSNENQKECQCDNVIIEKCVEEKSSIIVPETTQESDNKISINNGTKEELMKLSGIGEAKAEAIIKYRTNNAFKTIEELKNVTGISENLYEKIKNNIKL